MLETTHPIFSNDWFARAQSRVNADPEMQVIGTWFTTAFSLTCTGRGAEQRAIVRF
jgi:hypothetical protein